MRRPYTPPRGGQHPLGGPAAARGRSRGAGRRPRGHARRRWRGGFLTGVIAVVLAALVAPISPVRTVETAPLGQDAPAGPLRGRIVAAGVPGVSAISPVGTFHPGGPFRDRPEFAAFTEPGRVLDPERLLVVSTANFGAPLAHPDRPAGAVLSIEPRGSSPLVVPPAFAAAGGQAAALGGGVQLYTAQSPEFRNAVYNAAAVTAELPAVSNPRAISLNNAFGRPWFANAPAGAAGAGTESVTDPDGRPLAGAPSPFAGGVFAGGETNRRPGQLLPGALGSGAVGTALLGASPDGSRRAVFAVALADGSIAQIHVEKGVDGLAPAGTIGPLADLAPGAGAAATRAGMVFNWVPDRILYVADPARNAVVALTLVDDGEILRVGSVRRLEGGALDVPVDLAAAVPEVVNPAFASNTTLAGASDLYVANRGNGTIVRLRQDGAVVAARRIEVPGLGVLGPGGLNGIAVAPDAARLWVTVSGAIPGFGVEGAVVELPAFSTGLPARLPATGDGPSLVAPSDDPAGADAALVARGEALFRTDLTPENGLGPLYNAQSCLACHSAPVAGGAGPDGLGVALRVGRVGEGGFDPLVGRGGPIARAHAISELGFPCARQPGIPPGANLTSVRIAPALFGLGLIDALPDEAIAAGAGPREDGVRGRPNVVRDSLGRERVGRFGWKADTPTLEQFVAEAFRNEHGITNPLAPDDHLAVSERPVACAGHDPAATQPEDDGSLVAAVTAYVRSLAAPAPRRDPAETGVAEGLRVFRATGCMACHAADLRAAGGVVPLYSDLLLHDMGPALDDGVPQGGAGGRDWRTPPLWGLGMRTRFLHDGRAQTLDAAILAHGGEAESAVQRFRLLAPAARDALRAFLSSL